MTRQVSPMVYYNSSSGSDMSMPSVFTDKIDSKHLPIRVVDGQLIHFCTCYMSSILEYSPQEPGETRNVLSSLGITENIYGGIYFNIVSFERNH